MSHDSVPKRVLVFLITLAMAVTSLSGCGQETDDRLSVLIPLQKESFENFFDLFSEYHPEVTFDKSAYRGGSASAYLQRRFEVNDLTDIVIMSYPPEAETQEATLLDLSGYDFVHNYKANVLTNLSVDGKIYMLECPSSLRGIAYNKTMFEEYDWEVPQSHEEFLALLKQISEESDILPLGLQGKYPGTYFTLMSELSYCDYLQTPAGADWMRRFAKGEASSSEGFASGIGLLQDWMDAGAFDPMHMTEGDSTIYPKFAERECAMVYIMGSQNKLVEQIENSSDEFGAFPIYGRGEDSEFVASTNGLKIGLNKRLGEPGNEEKLEKALAVMEFLSTEEGQMVFHTGRGDILPLEGSDTSYSELFEQLSAVVDRGHSAPFLYTGYEDVLAGAGEYLKNACNNGGDLTEVFDLMDKLRQDSLSNQEEYVAVVSETLDEFQTAQFVANALHAQGYGDFALVSRGHYSRYFDIAGGANGKLYEGGITTMGANGPLTNLAPTNTVTLTLTGAQVIDLLENGRVLKDDEGHTDSFDYYSAGLDVERDQDGSVESVSFNGAPLEETRVYTVAFSPQDYSDETAAIGNPQDTGIAWEEGYRSYIVGLGTITPEHAK